jgi:hypothetical protein
VYTHARHGRPSRGSVGLDAKSLDAVTMYQIRTQCRVKCEYAPIYDLVV